MIIILSSSIHFFISKIWLSERNERTNYCPHQVWSSLWRQRQAKMACTKHQKNRRAPKKKPILGGFQTFWKKNGPQKCMIRLHPHNFSFPQKLYVEKPYFSKGNTSSNGGCFSVMFFVGGVPFFHMIYTSSCISKVISAVVTPCCYPKRRCQISPKKSKFPMNQTPWNAKKTLRISPFNPAPSFWYTPEVEQRVYPWKMVGKGRRRTILPIGFWENFSGVNSLWNFRRVGNFPNLPP